MNANKSFFEQVQACIGFVPVDMQSAANNGDWVNLANYQKAVVLFVKAAGTAGDDPTLTLREAKDNAGTSAQNLAKIARVYTKQGTLTSVGQYTQTNQTAAATYTNDTLAENQAIVGFEVDARDLSEDYTHIQVNVADIGNNAQLGTLLYLLVEPRFSGDSLPSAL